MVRVELDGRHYDVEMCWDKVPATGGWAWWMRSIKGEPRPAGKDVRRIYQRALELAQRALSRREESR